MGYLELLAGVVLVAAVLYDVFETIVVPRRTDARWRISPPILFVLWPVWQKVGIRMKPAWRREDFLGTFAPFAIVLILVAWVVALVLSFGLVFHALGHDFTPELESYLTAVYAAGTALLTIGFGDFVPTGMASRTLSLLAGVSGLVIVALVISLTFNLYASFARREALVLLLDSRAGVPPSGVSLLETYADKGIVGELSPLFYQYELWAAELLDSHLAYPILPFFRSSHDGQSWVSALGAVLDAATLLLTAVEEPRTNEVLSPLVHELRASRAAASMMYQIGCHALVDLTQFRLIRKHTHFAIDPGIERHEFEEACRRLITAGYPAVCHDSAWNAFAEHRSAYAVRLNIMARFLATPPTQWIGDRSLIAQRRVMLHEE